MTFDCFGLSADILRALRTEGYTAPTPIQAQAIPLVIAGRDLLAAAQTGTGKTAAFTLPILQRLGAAPVRHRAPRALVLTPTRELAAQVRESVRSYGRHLPLRSTAVFGGVGINPQISALRGGVDVVVATPGRLLDHLQQRTVDLSRVEIFVLDEADRMLDMGFIRDIRKVMAALPQKRQNLLFSATFSAEIRKLADQILNDPASVDTAPRNSVAELITHKVHPVAQSRKRALLAHLIGNGKWSQVLVFTRTKHGANRLATQLDRDGLNATAIHSSKSQSARTKALQDFKRGRVRVLVATDIAARGLDIEALPHVVNYELSNIAEDYVHRIGRTGRAGSKGQAVSLVSADERKHLSNIERLLGRRLPCTVIEGFEPVAANEALSPDPARPHTHRPHRKPHQSAYANNGGGPGHNTRPRGNRRPARTATN